MLCSFIWLDEVTQIYQEDFVCFVLYKENAVKQLAKSLAANVQWGWNWNLQSPTNSLTTAWFCTSKIIRILNDFKVWLYSLPVIPRQKPVVMLQSLKPGQEAFLQPGHPYSECSLSHVFQDTFPRERKWNSFLILPSIAGKWNKCLKGNSISSDVWLDGQLCAGRTTVHTCLASCCTNGLHLASPEAVILFACRFSTVTKTRNLFLKTVILVSFLSL